MDEGRAGMLKGGVPLLLRMRLRAAPFVIGLAIAGGGCYQQPEISREKPLGCTSSDASGECPRGFACFGDRVCIPTSCTVKDDRCPVGFACTENRCRPMTGDGGAGADRGADVVTEPPLDGPDAGVAPIDAASTPDTAPRLDSSTAAEGGAGGN